MRGVVFFLGGAAGILLCLEWDFSLQEKLLLALSFVDAKNKKLPQKLFFASTFWLMHSDAINRAT
jgi:hypothetical protein